MRKPFSGWRAGLPFFGPVLLAAVIFFMLPIAAAKIAGVFILLLGLAMLVFFRDFPRTIAPAENEAVSPADGTVVAIEDLDASPHYAGACRRVSIFLSVFNVHVNRAPLAGTVSAVEYTPGQFLDARNPECSKLNEANLIHLDTAYGPVSVRQVSGAVARRIVCETVQGDALAKGERFGMIRFGSRTELFLPPGTEVPLTNGQKVVGGITVVARFEGS